LNFDFTMRVLLGTPIHESKDYAMDKWIASVSKFDYPFDLLMVDNSGNIKYVDRLHEYCKKHGVINYKLEHIDIDHDAILDEKLAQSREIIRREVLDKGYDAWFSLECDVIAPPDALSKLVGLIADYWMVNHVYPTRGNPNESNQQLGITLVKRHVLEKYGFSNGYGYVNPLQPDIWFGGDVWFIRQIDLTSEGKRITVSGMIKPIYHLDK